MEAKKMIESVEAGLALLNGTGARSKKYCKKKTLVKAKEDTKETLAKTQETDVRISFVDISMMVT